MSMPFTEQSGLDWIVRTPVISTDSAGVVTEEIVRPRRQLGRLDFAPPEPVAFSLPRDPVAETAAKIAEGEKLWRSLNPTLYDARAQHAKAVRVVQHYARELSDLRFSLSQAQSEMLNTSPHTPVGIKEQRQQHVHALAAGLADAAAEYQAAMEECEQAEAAMRELMAAHPVMDGSKVQL